jgi:hypothetical protein
MSVSFDRWFQQQGQRPAADESDLPDGLHLRDGKVMATCRVCECEYWWVFRKPRTPGVNACDQPKERT